MNTDASAMTDKRIRTRRDCSTFFHAGELGTVLYPSATGFMVRLDRGTQLWMHPSEFQVLPSLARPWYVRVSEWLWGWLA